MALAESPITVSILALISGERASITCFKSVCTLSAASPAALSDSSLDIRWTSSLAKIYWMMFQPTSKVTRTPRNEITRFDSWNPHRLLIRAKPATIRAVRDRYIDFITYNFRNSTVQI